MPHLTVRVRALVTIAAVIGAFFCYRSLFAVDRTWDGNCQAGAPGCTRTPAWTDGRNWIGDVAPVANDTLIFGPSSFQLSTQNTYPADTTFHSMVYPGGTYGQIGNAITLTNGVTATGNGAATIVLPITLSQAQAFTATTSANSLTFTGGTITTGGHTLTLAGAGGIILNSPVTGSGGITVQGTGAFTLTGNHPYTGTTQVNGSTLNISGTFAGSAFSLRGTSVLRGIGSVDGLSVSVGSTVNPGAEDNDGTGILNSTADLQFFLGAAAFDLKGLTPGTQHDQISVTGAVRLSSPVTIGSPLLVVKLPAFEPNAGSSFTIVLNDGTDDPVEGTFSGLPEGASFTLPDGGPPGSTTTFFITYRGGDGNDIVLHSAANRLWDGGGGDNLWRTAANWFGDVAPEVGDTLRFNGGAPRPSSVNDFPPGTTFRQLLFQGSAGFTLSGNGIQVPMEVFDLSDSSMGSNQINLAVGGGGVVRKGGTGRLILAGGNTYTGATTVSQGELRVIGTQPASAIALDGGMVSGNGTVGALTAGSNPATIAPGGDGNTTGVLSTGTLTLGAATTYVVNAGLSAFPGAGHDQLNVVGTVSLNNAQLTVSSNASSVPPAGYQAVIIGNDGTDAVSGTFAGSSEGSLVFDGPLVGDEMFISYRGGDGNDVVLYSPGTATWSGGSGGFTNWSTPANWVLNRVPLPRERLVFPATGQSVSVNDYPAGLALRSIEITGPHTLNGNPVQLTEDLLHTSTQNAAVNVSIGGAGGIIQNGPGRLILLTSNPFTGIVSVVQGTLQINNAAALGAVGTNSTVVAAGGTLRVALPAGSDNVNEAVQLNGSGVGGIGALEATGGNSMTWAGPITLASTAAIGSSQEVGQLFVLRGQISGSGGLTKVGIGEVRLQGNALNTYTGPTAVTAGILSLQRPSTNTSSISVGDGIDESGPARSTLIADEPQQLPPGAAVTVNGGFLRLENETIGSLSMAPGSLVQNNVDNAVLALTGDVVMSSSNSAGTFINLSRLLLGGTRTFTANGTGGSLISAQIENGGAPADLIKAGSGLLQLSSPTGINTYSGVTTVAGGVLAITNGLLLGATTAGTVVNAGATLFLSFPAPSTSQEPLSLIGTGFLDSGAMQASGDATWNGPITLGGDTSIFVSSTASLSVASAAGTGELVKSGGGELRLTGAGSSRPSRLRGGSLVVQAPHPEPVVLESGTLAGTSTTGAISAAGNGVKSIAPGASAGRLTVAGIQWSPTTTFDVELFGAAAGTQHDQLVVNGDVALGDATLSLVPFFAAALDQTFVILANDGTDAVNGTFAGLPEGAAPTFLGQRFQITYRGGDGNDVVLKRVSDTLPTISITDVVANEGNAGTANALFLVTLSPPSAQQITVQFATGDGTATAASGDYASRAGTLTFAPNETTATIAVPIVGDTTAEPDETFTVSLSAPVNALLGDGQARGTILNDDVGPTITIDGPSAITATSPFLTLRGTASDDFGIGRITWTNDRGGSGAAEGTTSWVIRGIPLRKGVNVITVTADDIDGSLNPAEVDPSADRLNKASATITVTVNEFLYFLAEGATGNFFDEDIAIANPNGVAAPVTVTFLKEDGTTVPHTLTVPATGRATIAVEQIPGLSATAVSAVVSSTEALPLVVERSMFWDSAYYGAHTGSAVDGAKTTWLFGEGSQGFFDTFVLLANASAAPATVTVTFLTESGGPVTRVVTVGATSRLNVFTGAIPELVGRSFSIVVDADRPIIAERAMYFGTPLFNGGHESAGVSEPATSWFHAEGATGAFFDTFILVGNPNAVPATVTFTYLLDTGQVVTRVKTVAPSSRLTVDVEAEDPLLRNAAVSTTVTSSVPVISERAMYWPGSFTTWFEAHNSFGLTEVATKWGLAEGRVGGPQAFETYILLANPNATTANVTVTYLRANGSTVVKTYPVTPTSRFNVFVNGFVPELANEAFGAVITSDVPIAVERALYNSSGGIVFAAGTNAIAVKLPQ